ncbi:MAG: hypothetical protein K8I00_03670 [Candidatus Omnitrophica bacterium]|nr:hypothetical protein [Candidatus Omnitrophota bacterium]
MGSIQRGKHVDAARNLRMTVLELSRNELKIVADLKSVFITGSKKGTDDAQQ